MNGYVHPGGNAQPSPDSAPRCSLFSFCPAAKKKKEEGNHTCPVLHGRDLFLFTHLTVEVSVLFIYATSSQSGRRLPNARRDLAVSVTGRAPRRR